MAQILVRNIEDSVKEALRARARRHGSSLEQYLRDILRAEAVRREPEVGLGTQIREMFRGDPTGIPDVEMPDFEALRGTSRLPLDFSGPEYGRDDDG